MSVEPKTARRILFGTGLLSIVGIALAWRGVPSPSQLARPVAPGEERTSVETAGASITASLAVASDVAKAHTPEGITRRVRGKPSRRADADVDTNLGTDASLLVRVGDGELATPITVEFLNGLQRGAVLDGVANAEISGLYAGACVVAVEGAGLPRCVRDVRLLPHKTAELDLRAIDPLTVRGVVTDVSGAPVAGALVKVDGSETRTDGLGQFAHTQHVAGRPLVVAEADGFATWAAGLAPNPRRDYNAHPLELRLQPACSLEVQVRAAALFGQAEVRVRAARTESRGRGFVASSYAVEPRPVAVGGTLLFESLPPGDIWIAALHAAGQSRPKRALLTAEHARRVDLELDAFPQMVGELHAGGAPIANAKLVLEATDKLKASRFALGPGSNVLELAPSSAQVAYTDGNGRFAFGVDAAKSQLTSKLSVYLPDGSLAAVQRVHAAPRSLALELADELR